MLHTWPLNDSLTDQSAPKSSICQNRDTSVSWNVLVSYELYKAFESFVKEKVFQKKNSHEKKSKPNVEKQN